MEKEPAALCKFPWWRILLHMYFRKIASTALMFVAAFLGLFVIGCKPERSIDDPFADALAGYKALAPLQDALHTFQVAAGKHTTITGPKGTWLHFYPNSFLDTAGRVLTTGTVDISLLEVYRPGEMIANRVSTRHNGECLMSGGQVYLQASMNGQRLNSGGYDMGFRQPGPSTQTMFLFSGDRSRDDSVVAWQEVITDSSRAAFGTTNKVDTSFYMFYGVRNFNWINCDYFYNSREPRTTVTVTPAISGMNDENTIVWLVFPDINATTNLANIRVGSPSFTLPAGYLIPEKLKFHVVLISYKEKVWYYAEQRDLQVSTAMKLQLSPAISDFATIREKLTKL